MVNGSVFVVLLLVFSGCCVNQALYNPYAFAPLKPYTYYFPKKEKGETKEIETPALPDQDRPLTLAEIIDIALRNTPETTKTWAAARAAAARYSVTQAPFLPQIDGVGNYTRAKTPALTRNIKGDRTVVTSFSTQIQPQLQLTYTLLDFGQRRFTSEIARYTLHFADWIHNRKIQAVVQTITNDYHNYIFQLKLQESIIANIGTARTTLNFALAEQLSGTKDIADVLQAKTLLLEREMNLAAQKKLVQATLSTLLKDMGVPSDTKVTFEDIPEHTSTDILLKDVEHLIADAIVLRPDLRAQEANVKAKEAELNLTYSNLFPTLSYQFNWGRTYFQNWLHDKNDWTGVMSLNFPIFSGFSQLNDIKEAKANKASALAKLRDTELEITKQITTSHTDVKASAETLEYAKSFLSSANDQYEVALRKYRFGLASILDVVSAQDSLADARIRLARSVQQWYISLADLVFAVGYYTSNSEVLE